MMAKEVTGQPLERIAIATTVIARIKAVFLGYAVYNRCFSRKGEFTF
mgnify:CR=1 FL=1